MATKFFSKILMASESIQSYVRSTKYQVDGADAEIHDGAFVKLGNIAGDNTYASGGLNFNAYLSTTPSTVATDKVVVVDIANVSEGTIGGEVYKKGSKLYGLTVQSGHLARVRLMAEKDLFLLGDGNFASAPTAGEYAILTDGSTLLTPSSTVPGTGFTVKILEEQNFEPGQLSKGKQYACEVVQL